MPDTEGSGPQQQPATQYTPLGWAAAFPAHLGAQAVALEHSMDSIDESMASTSSAAPPAGAVSPAVIAAFLAQQQNQPQPFDSDDDTEVDDSRANALASATSGSLDEYIAAEHEQHPQLRQQHLQQQIRLQEQRQQQEQQQQQAQQQRQQEQRQVTQQQSSSLDAKAAAPAAASAPHKSTRRRRSWPKWLKHLASAAVAAGLVAGGVAVGIEAYRIHMRHLDDREELVSQIEAHKRTEEKLLGRCMAAEKARDDARAAVEQASSARAAAVAKVKALEADAKAAAADKEELVRLNVNLQRKLSEADAKSEKLEGSCAAAREQVEGAKAENGRLSKQVGDLERQIERWQVRCGELEGSMSSLQKEHERTEARAAAELKRIKQTIRSGKGGC